MIRIRATGMSSFGSTGRVWAPAPTWALLKAADVRLGVGKLAESVLEYIREQGLLKAGDRAGIAVSGGTDSVALLRLLLELRQEIGVVLCVVHFNHNLRGAESDADERFVGQLA